MQKLQSTLTSIDHICEPSLTGDHICVTNECSALDAETQITGSTWMEMIGIPGFPQTLIGCGVVRMLYPRMKQHFCPRTTLIRVFSSAAQDTQSDALGIIW